jgi:hypothetical protein
MKAHLAGSGSIVVNKYTGKRFEVLGPGLDLDTLRLRDVETNGVWLNADAGEYEAEKR